MKINDILELEIIDYNHEGIGFAKHEGFPVFIKNTIVGEKVKAKITYINSKIAEATLVDILVKSPKRCEGLCEYYPRCGGCNILHMSYDEQLRFKHKLVEDTFRKLGGMEVNVCDVEKNDTLYHYRNKIIVPFSEMNGEIESGFFEANSHTLVCQNACLIENENARKIIEYIKKLIRKYNFSVYDEATHKGMIRNVMIRTTCNGDLMLVLVVLEDNSKLKSLLQDVASRFDFIKSIFVNINPNKTNVILNPTGFKHVMLEETITEEINGLRFKVHPNSFLQINHSQTEKLYKKAISLIEDDSKVIIDAYCGIGSITLNLASKAKEVYGIEIVPQAVENANENKMLNNIENVSFLCGKCEEEIIKLVNLKGVDTIVCDPPRKGCDTKFLDTVIKMGIKNVIYISCNVATLARDSKYLVENGYEIGDVYPFDLFSHSFHTEVLVKLSLK